MTEARRRASELLGLGAAACVACCAAPVLVVGGSVAALAGTLILGAAGIVLAAAAFGGVLAARRRRSSCCATERSPMSTEPIYDANAPVACSATGDGLSARLEQISTLRDALTSIERTEHGMLLRFPNRPDVDAEVRRFALEEKACCQFWGFAVIPSDQEISLRWDAPPAADEHVVRLVAFFEGDEPASAIAGLL